MQKVLAQKAGCRMIFCGHKSKVYIVFRKTSFKGKNKISRSQQIIIVKPILQSNNITHNTNRHVIFNVYVGLRVYFYLHKIIL